MFKLSERDAQAVDLYLETRSEGAKEGANGSGQRGKALPASVRQRLDAAGRLFDALSLAQAEDPPADLVARTLASIERGAVKRKAALPAREINEPQEERPQVRSEA